MNLRSIRRISGVALVLGWIVTAAVGLHALGARDGRGVARHIAIEILCGGLSLGATAVYANAKLTRRHIDDLKWALGAEPGLPVEAPTVPRQASASNVYPIRKDGTG